MKSKKLLTLISNACLILALAALPFMAACAPEAPPEEPTPEEVYTLRLADHASLGERGSRTYMMKEICDEIEKRTNGRVKFEYYWSGSLCDPREMADALRGGLCDLGLVDVQRHPDKFPLSTVVVAVPFFPETMEQAVSVSWELRTFPPIAAEWERWNLHIAGILTAPPKNIGATKPIRNLDDIKGVKCRALAEADVKIWAAAGGIPINIPAMSEVYSAVDTGLISAHYTGLSIHLVYGMSKLTPYISSFVLGSTWASPLAISKDSLNKLPPELREIVLEGLAEVGQRYLDIYHDEAERMRKTLVEEGVQFIDFSESDIEKLRNMPEIQSIAGDWVKDKEGKGLPGKEVMDRYLEIMSQYK